MALDYHLKVGSFCWETFLGRVNTGDLLQRKRSNNCLSPHWCVLYKSDGGPPLECSKLVFFHA